MLERVVATSGSISVGVIGAHSWAEQAHLPAYAANDRYRRVAICDVIPERARQAADRFGFAKAYGDVAELLADEDVALIDVCTSTDGHFDLALAALKAGKHVLCEKPVARSTADAFTLVREAALTRRHTKVGFTYRHSPAMRQIKAWIEGGVLGEIFHVHGFMQNSQFLDPDVPMRQYSADAASGVLTAASVVGYGSHLVDAMRWLAGEFAAVSASMRNYVGERAVRGREGRHRLPIEDGTVAAVEFVSGAQGVIQTSYIAIGAFPGLEIRVYGSKGAAIARLVTERGIAETLQVATAEDPQFVPVSLPAEHFPAGASVKTPWPELYYRGLVDRFASEILDGSPPEGTFHDGAKAQQIVDAIVTSHTERRWVALAELDRLETAA